MTPERPTRLPHTATAEAVVAALATDPVNGLSEAEAARRLEEYGPNELTATGGTEVWHILVSQFTDVLILILFVAIGLSLVLGHTLEAIVIGAIVVFSIVLGFVQEYRAERALEALRRLASPSATVMREGQVRDIASEEVVPGDVIVLTTGNVVPADGRLVETANLRIDEAALTGESSPVQKHADVIADDQTALGDRKNVVFSSTAVTHGRGRAVVVATGEDTEVGRIGALLETVETSKTALEDDLQGVGKALAWGAAAIVLVIAVLGLIQGRPLVEMIIFGIALAVAVVPEALPAVVTVSLALGARRLVRRNGLIRRLPTVESLGSVTVICSDKTGTLTTGQMTLREIYTAGGSVEVTGAGYEPSGGFRRADDAVEAEDDLVEVLEAAALSTDAELVHDGSEDRWKVRGDPTEGALIVAAAKADRWKTSLEAANPRVAEIPFSSERKRMTTIHAGSTGRWSISKGAPEVILGACDRVRTSAGVRDLDDTERERILEVAQEMGSRALRVLAVARREDTDLAGAEEQMIFLGLVGMLDPPRPEVRAAIETCFTAGIRPVMITGDHPITAKAIAAELGLLEHGAVLTGVELDAMSDDELVRRVADTDVYARVSPEHKLRVVSALQERGDVCAMTGDGVNDAPALKKADVGVAMGVTGTDVAKGAADMILTDDNFASIVAAVEEGRGIFDNIKKYLMYLLSSNIGEILLMAAAVLLGLPLPLTAVQILYVNLATDGLPALALAVDPPEPDLMVRRPRKVEEGIFNRPITVLILLGGVWSAFVNIALFTWALGSGRPPAEAVTMTFVSLVLIQFFKAYSFRSERHSIMNRPFANKWLDRAILWELALLLLVIYLPVLQQAFGTYPLTGSDWTILLLTASTVVPMLEMAKWMERRGWFGAWD
ncbi:MAG: cation-translocating P-type ATPase [Gemmatimonadota bacterium]|jgi:Ca2+-transporting ATPase